MRARRAELSLTSAELRKQKQDVHESRKEGKLGEKAARRKLNMLELELANLTKRKAELVDENVSDDE